jgi:hypothetical protein
MKISEMVLTGGSVFDVYISEEGCIKEIVSRDWGGLLMVLLD